MVNVDDEFLMYGEEVSVEIIVSHFNAKLFSGVMVYKTAVLTVYSISL